MHPSLWLTFFLIGWGSAAAQSNQLSVSWHYQPANQHQQLRAEYRAAPWGDSLSLHLHNAKLNKIFWREGRRKKELNFRYRKALLEIAIPPHADPRSSVEILYQIDLQKLCVGPFGQMGEEGQLLLNPDNFNNPGVEGMGGFAVLYPVEREASVVVELNLHLPRGYDYRGPFRKSFSVKTPEGQAHYLSSVEPLSTADFYLLLGKSPLPESPALVALAQADLMRREMKKAMEDSAHLGESPPAVLSAKVAQDLREEGGKRVAQTLREQLLPFAQFLEERGASPLRVKDFSALAKNEPALRPGFFFYPEELPAASRNTALFALQQDLALLALDGDTAQARRLHWQFHRAGEGEEWARQVLMRHYRLEEWEDAFFWEEFLGLFLAEQNLHFRDTVLFAQKKITTAQEATLSLAREVYRRRRPLALALRYRYYAPEKSLQLLAQVEDASREVALPLVLHYYLSDRQESDTLILRLSPRDTLSVFTRESPRSASVELWPLSPVQLEQERPESYYLYELVKSKDDLIRRRALSFLLETKNANLRATVVGIALGIEEKELQLQALEKANLLEGNGKLRLKSTLEELAREAPSEEVRETAAKVVEQLYP